MCAGPFYRGPAYSMAILCMCKAVFSCCLAYGMAILCMYTVPVLRSLAYSMTIPGIADRDKMSGLAYNIAIRCIPGKGTILSDENFKDTFSNNINDYDVCAGRLQRQQQCRP